MKKENVSEIFKNKFNEALTLKNQNKLNDSLNMFINLSKEYPEHFIVYVFIGLIYWDLHKLNDASLAFKKAVELNPKSEKTSIGFFHLLWEQGNQIEALDEMKRFLKDNISKEYNFILEGINNSISNNKVEF